MVQNISEAKPSCWSYVRLSAAKDSGVGVGVAPLKKSACAHGTEVLLRIFLSFGTSPEVSLCSFGIVNGGWLKINR